MSSLNVPGPSPYASFFRHRALGRAPSPPTWACYEQIQYDGDYSGDSASDGDSHDDDDDDDDDDEEHDRDDSCSEDDEDYGRLPDSPSSSVQSHEPPPSLEESEKSKDSLEDAKKDVKGKGRAVDPQHEVGDPVQPPPSKPRLRSKKRHSGRRGRTLRPILTIHKSQGFVWNQDLFVPPYIKDRYVASTSPPNSRGFVSSSASSTTSFPDYEVEVVEIRVDEGYLSKIIP